LVVKADSRDFSEATPAMNDSMLPLPGLSSVSGKPVVVKFDGGLLSSDGGILALREVEQRLRVADRLAACMVDRRARRAKGRSSSNSGSTTPSTRDRTRPTRLASWRVRRNGSR